jgi:hypothetical protein
MNEKTCKAISRQTENILVLWLKTLVTEEEAAKINHHNYKSLMPKQTHIKANGRFMLSAFTPKWVRKHIKNLVRLNPERAVFTFTLTEVMEESRTWKNARASS